MSNYFGKNPVSECGRYNRSPKKKIKLPCLAVVQVYIKFMGGLDKADILISLHKTKCKTKKWYHWIFFHLLTLSIVNAWIIYREIGGNGTLLDFIIRTSRCLISATSDSNDEIQELPQKRRSGIRANQVPDDIQYDVKNHDLTIKLMVQLKEVNRLDALAEADSCARNAKLFFLLLAVNSFWSFMVRYQSVFLYLKFLIQKAIITLDTF